MAEPAKTDPIGDSIHALHEAQAYLLGARSILDVDSGPLSDEHRLSADVLLRDLGARLAAIVEALDRHALAARAAARP